MNPIPKIIWQTFVAEDDLDERAHRCRQTWRLLNPEWQVRFASDSDIGDYIALNFPDFLPTFRSLPLGVMKADFWRYAVLFKEGGFYADIDTVCREPLDQWLDTSADGLHVACENHHPYFCQWAMGASPGHPALLSVLELIRARVDEDRGVNPARPHFVHYYTGPDVWTSAIQECLGCQMQPREIVEARGFWEGRGYHLRPEGDFNFGPIGHANASLSWRGSGYASWQDQRWEMVRTTKVPAPEQEHEIEVLQGLLTPRHHPALKRYGPRGDGGYVVATDALQKATAVYSYGVGSQPHETEFDLEMAALGKLVHLYDATVEVLGMTHPNFRFFRENVGPGDLMRHLRENGHLDERNLLLKMDIEGHEMGVLLGCEEEVFDRFAQIVIEVHGLLPLGMCFLAGHPRPGADTRNQREMLERLSMRYELVHLHANNYGDFCGGMPDVLELLFLRRDLISNDDRRPAPPCPRKGLDYPNDPAVPEIALDWWL